MLAHATKLCALMLSALLVPLAQAVAELNPKVESAIDAIGKEVITSGKSAGLVIAVAEQGRPVFIRGYGQASLEWQVPMSTDAVFRIGSITKQFAAAAILLLSEQGKLSIDDKLAKFFPDFPRASEVSVRQLLNHTSGIHNYPGDSERIIVRTGMAVPELVEHLGTLGYDFDPGTSWSYSNSGYFLIGAIIEQVSGQSFRDFARQRLFDPLGMPDTAVDVDTEVARHRATGYSSDPASKSAFRNADFTDMSVPHAAGAIRSTAEDLIKWTAALHGGRVLNPVSYKEMTTAVNVPGAKEQPRYGMGLHTEPLLGHPAFRHGGSIDGFEARLAYLVNTRTTLVILANTEGGARDLDEAVVKALWQSSGKGSAIKQ